jgi:hypothetical protein
MQEVQTRMRLGAPLTTAWTFCKLMFQRRLVKLWAWLTLFPNWGPRPHRSQDLDINTLTPSTISLYSVYHIAYLGGIIDA